MEFTIGKKCWLLNPSPENPTQGVPYGTRWVGFSGEGLSLDQLLNEPTCNGLYSGSRLISYRLIE